MRRLGSVIALAGLAAVFAASYAVVRPTNFSGWDEWLVLDLTSRGTIGLPFENRPLSLLFNLPGSLLTPAGLRGFWIVHAIYLWTAAACVWLLVRRTVPESPRLAFLAAAISATWAPSDRMRLDPVLLSNYSGATAATFVALVLLVEASRSRRWWLALAGAGLAFATVRALESTVALLLAAPLLLWLVSHAADARVRRRMAAAWTLALLPAVALVLRPLWPGQPPSYQLSGLGFDPNPVRVLLRLAVQLRYQFVPLLTTSPRELLAWSAVIAATLFAGSWALLGRAGAGGGPPSDAPQSPKAAARLLGFGAAALVLAHIVLVLSSSMRSPLRMQILSAPGAGVLLCAVLAAAASRLPRPLRRLLLPAAGALVVALGTARTAALQRDWDARSMWPAQNATLVGLTRAAPGLAPGTLVLLLDPAGSWPAGFTFRHAVRFLYGPSVVGAVWGAQPFLYPFQFVAEGVLTTPYESIRAPWHAPVTLHPYPSVVVVRAGDAGVVELVEQWPDAVLPPLPRGAAYAPRLRIREAPPRPQRAVLVDPVPRRSAAAVR